MSEHASFLCSIFFAICSSQWAPKGSAERSNDPFLVAWLAQNLLITSPASQHREFGFPHTITFSPFCTCFSFIMFHLFAFFLSQYAPTDLEEHPTSTTFSRLSGTYLLFAQPASPQGHSVCFRFHTLLHLCQFIFVSVCTHLITQQIFINMVDVT